MRKKSILVFVFIVFLLSSTSSLATIASFQGLGDLAGGSVHSSALGVSADGSVVVGWSDSTLGGRAFRWTQASGMQQLGDLPSGDYAYEAHGVSADGSVVVGKAVFSSSGSQGFRWTESGGVQSLGGGSAFDVSDDGLVVVGYDYRWTQSGGTQGLGFSGHPLGVSADGSVIVGWNYSENQAFRWSESGGVIGLGDLAGGDFYSTARGVSADGSVVVGYGTSELGREAVRWTQILGIQSLGSGVAFAVSKDGSVIVGQGNFASGYAAFIWDETNGMRNVKDVLENDYGVDLTGWTLFRARGVSADGLTIAGEGVNPDGYVEGWVATVPEPCTLLLLGLGGVMLSTKR